MISTVLTMILPTLIHAAGTMNERTTNERELFIGIATFCEKIFCQQIPSSKKCTVVTDTKNKINLG